MTSKKFTVVLGRGPRNSVYVPLPFDPSKVWGAKSVHHLAGTVGGMRFRGEVETIGDGQGLVLGVAWRRDCGLSPGDEVDVELMPEGPHRDALDPDIAAAFEAVPDAGAFFDSLAQFYRKAYLSWIGATKKSPEKRVERIAETVKLLQAGKKQRD